MNKNNTKIDDIIIHIDGAAKGNNNKSIPNKSYICIVVPIHNLKIIEPIGNMSNNEAEWQALISALKLSIERGWKKIKVYSDSQLVVNQFNNDWCCKKQQMLDFYVYAKILEELIDIDLKWIARQFNLAGIELGRRF